MKVVPFVLLTLSCGTISVGAATLFSDDFESDTVGTEPASWDTVSGTVNILVADDGIFGSPNQYVHFNDVGSGGLSLFKQLPEIDGIVSTFAFDFYEPTVAGANATLSVGYTAAGGDINATAAWRIVLDDGAITFSSGEVAAGTKSYSLDTAYRFYITINDTLSEVDYSSPSGGVETLGVGQFNVFFRPLSSSVFTYAGTGVNDTSDVVGRLGFRTFSSGDQVFSIDDVLISSVSPIPEPTTLGMFLAGLGALAACRRSRRHTPTNRYGRRNLTGFRPDSTVPSMSSATPTGPVS